MLVRGQPIYFADGCCSFRAGITIDADGSPRAYAPDNKGLDYTANAGHSGNWWGIVTVGGKPLVQNGASAAQPNAGYYISTTSLFRRQYVMTDVRRWIDSEKVPFIVVPGPLRKALPGIVLGCRAEVWNPHNNRRIACVVADVGPATHLGEGSIALAKLLQIPSNPRKGGTSESFLEYRFWPGQTVTIGGETFPLIPAK